MTAGSSNTSSASSRAILVTGASGFVGERLIHRLENRGVPAIGTYLSHSIRPRQTRMIPIDLIDAAAVRRLFEEARPRAVIHAAALTNVAICEQQPELARRAIVEATANLVAECKQSSIPIAMLSTDLVFDGKHAPYREGDETNPLSTYAKLKLEAERVTLASPKGAVLRAALIYGRPGTYAGSCLGWMLDTLRNGKELVLFEDEFRTPIYVDDLCVALEAFAEFPLTGLWHAGGPEVLNRVAMGEAVARVFRLSQSLLVARKLANSTYAAPRPPNTSLVSDRLWRQVAHVPRPFEKALREIAAELSADTAT
ncbi:MAG: SDR family oxidoreductase [Planctomycetota bacterium]